MMKPLPIKPRINLLLPLALVATVLTGAPPVCAAPPAGYYLVWADEFNSASLDTNKWNHWLLGARRDAINTANAVSVNGSNLVITTHTSNGVHYTGMIATHNTFRTKFGYWETSAKWGDTNGMWSAIWMQSPTMGANVNDPVTSGSEIDIAEHRRVDSGGNNIANQIQANIHWNGYGAAHQSTGSGNIGSGLATGYHTYEFLWTADSYNFRIDGSSKWTGGSAPVSRSTEWMILSSEVDDGSWAGNVPAGGYGSLAASTTKMLVDYCRYYAPTATIFWTGASDALWTSAANWIAGKTPGAQADLTFGNLTTGNSATQLGGNQSVNSLTVLESDSAISVNGPNTLTIGGGGVDMISADKSPSFNCPVNLGAAQTWVIGGSANLNVNSNLSGSATLTKSGRGGLYLKASNSFSGILYLDTARTSDSETNHDGEVRVITSGALANVPSPLQMRNDGDNTSTFELDGSSGPVTVTQDFNIAGRSSTTPAIQNIAGSNTLAGNVTLKAGGANLYIQSDAGTLVLAGTNRYLDSFTSGRIFNFLGAGGILVSGPLLAAANAAPVAVNKSGSGALTLAGTNTYGGGTTNAGGDIVLLNSRGLGTGPVTLNGASGIQLVLGAAGLNVTNALFMDGGGSVAQGALHFNQTGGSATYSGPITISSATQAGGHFASGGTGAELAVAGPITATTNVTVRGGWITLSNAASSFSEIRLSEGILKLGVSNAIPPNATLFVGDIVNNSVTARFDLAGKNQELAWLTNNLTGSSSSSRITNSAGTPAILTLSIAAGLENQLRGPLYNSTLEGNLALLKKSDGRLVLVAGGSTYSGGTIVSAGTLLVNNASGSGTGTGLVTVSSGGTLGGTGSIGGAVTVNAGGTLSPGASIGTLTLNSSLTLAGIVLAEVNTPTNDKVVVAAALTNAGTASVIISNLGPAFVAGNSFQLFNKAVANGGAMAISPPPGAGLVWSNRLGLDGSIMVVTVAPPAAPEFIPGGVTRLPDGSIALSASAIPGVNFRLWAATNVVLWPVEATWILLTNGAVVSNPFTIVDSTATNHPLRFYRFSTP